jgi:two-component system sensor histidine kinase QseC
MSSIRRKLNGTLLAGLFVLFTAASAALYLYTRGALVREFDDALSAKLVTLTKLTEVEMKSDRVVVELEFHAYPLPEFQPSPDAEFYQVWSADGSVLAKSASMDGHDLPDIDTSGTISDLSLPDGRKGRCAVLWFTPAPDPDRIAPEFGEGDDGPRLRMALARSRENLDNILVSLMLGFSGIGLLLLGLVAVIVGASIRKGLKPLARIADEAASIEPDKLSHRFPSSGLPDELVPITTRLNELLERLEAAFAREKRFTADMAHELRTPVAELRLLSEVALNKASNADYYDASQGCFRDAREIALQMEKLITTLFSLLRSENGRVEVQSEFTDAVELIKRAGRRHEAKARDRKITLEEDLPEAAVISTDRTLLLAVLDNLFSNAVSHTPEGGSVRCRLESQSSGYLFTLENTNTLLDKNDLDRIFEPLWKKDPSRTQAESNGLGLSLVAAYADLLSIELRTDLPGPDRFAISFHLS